MPATTPQHARRFPDMTTTPVTASSARIPLQHQDTVLFRLAAAWSRRRYGKVLDSALARIHNRRVLMTMGLLELGLERWSSLDHELKDLVDAAVAAQIGCSWCMDFGYYLARNRGMDRTKLEALPEWRSSEVYSPLERKVLGYAEAMTATPPEVTDEMVAGLREELSDEQLVELTEMISVENLRSRTNSALGLTSQGFKDQCEVPTR
jgi:AhpD family alkylhydroperoxidase